MAVNVTGVWGIAGAGPAANATAAAGGGAVTGMALARREDFFRLLVAQLQHQDPLQPLEDKDFIGQLAQFSTLEQVQRLNDSQALTLLGRTVQALCGTGADGAPESVVGRVSAVTFSSDGMRLEVEGRQVRFQDVIQVWA